MMELLLAEIRSGGTFEAGHLASRLGTTPEMVLAMLEHLQQAGLIQNYTPCADACGGCSLQDGCRHADDGKTDRKAVRLFSFHS